MTKARPKLPYEPPAINTPFSFAKVKTIPVVGDTCVGGGGAISCTAGNNANPICNLGTAVVGACTDGDATVGGICNAGTSATTGCTGGQEVDGNCTTGSSPGGGGGDCSDGQNAASCLSGGAFTPPPDCTLGSLATNCGSGSSANNCGIGGSAVTNNCTSGASPMGPICTSGGSARSTCIIGTSVGSCSIGTAIT